MLRWFVEIWKVIVAGGVLVGLQSAQPLFGNFQKLYFLFQIEIIAWHLVSVLAVVTVHKKLLIGLLVDVSIDSSLQSSIIWFVVAEFIIVLVREVLHVRVLAKGQTGVTSITLRIFNNIRQLLKLKPCWLPHTLIPDHRLRNRTISAPVINCLYILLYFIILYAQDTFMSLDSAMKWSTMIIYFLF